MSDSSRWEELKDQLYDGVIDGDEHSVSELTREALAEGMGAEEVLYDALLPALEEVGELFEKGEYFVPEMLTGAKAMKSGLNVLRPILAQGGTKPVGTYLLLTVKGDIHDIGKDLVRVMLEAAGFHVIDLGVNVSPETMIEAIEEHKPEIVGFSAFLTTTMPMFKTNIDALIEAGLRDQVKVMVGGAPITEEYAIHVGADGFAEEASTTTRIANDFLENPDDSQYLLQAKAHTPTQSFARIKGSFDLPKPKRRFPSKPAMTSLERVLAVLNHEEPDRVPHFEWVHDADLIQTMTRGGDYWDLIELLDIDGVMVAPAYRKQDLGGNRLVDEWGAVREIGKDNYAMPVDAQAPLKTLKDLETWQPPDPDDDFRYDRIRETVARFGGRRAIILQMRDVWSGPRDYIGYAQLFINLKECPELVEGVVTRCVDHYIRVIERAAEIGVDIVFSGDDVADNRGPMFKPELWENLFLPHYRRLVNAIHDVGLRHWKHSDGNMYPLLDSIVAAGSDGIDPIDPSGGMELKVVKAKYGDKVAIKGNVDQLELLMYGPPAAVVEAVKACIRDAGAGGGYVCSSSNSIHSGVDPELYRIMIDTIHHYGCYPLDVDMLAPVHSS
ncbi:MAG: uroporphyrinogen decarboxylase family protein [Chloroflexota bacterium]|nr:uroporphyrinogen decarboxylase family protein [Chloroflexota bacterium]